MRKWVAVSALVLLAGCESSADAGDYTVTKEEANKSIKRMVEVSIPERVSKAALERMAKEIHESGFDRTFIGYRIDGENSGTYWATTHYNPDLDVRIIGSTGSQHAHLDGEKPAVDGEILGVWRANRGYESKITIFSREGNLFIKQQFSDGSEIEQEALTEEVNGETRYYSGIRGREIGEYFVIAPDGQLQFWSDSGNYYTAQKDE